MTAVALVNKNARIIGALLGTGELSGWKSWRQPERSRPKALHQLERAD